MDNNTRVDVQMIGEFARKEYDVTLNGFRVPYLVSHPTNPQQTEWMIVLDRRMALDLSEDQLIPVVSFIADCMAVAAGYKSHHHACEHRGDRNNPFGTRLMGLGELPTKEDQTS